jgi:hypothetical protein
MPLLIPLAMRIRPSPWRDLPADDRASGDRFRP